MTCLNPPEWFWPVVADANGNPVKDANGNPIQIPPCKNDDQDLGEKQGALHNAGKILTIP